MKIEKINDNQLRFTLTREDLASHEIKLSELAYGSEKAKMLFRDMMQQAAEDYGFEVNNAPLMIEAIPISSDSIILIVTKVDDPDELDGRFSRFSLEDGPDKSQKASAPKPEPTGADDILNLIAKISEAKKKIIQETKKAKEAREKGLDEDKDERKTKIASEILGPSTEELENSNLPGSDEIYKITRFFLFHDLSTVIRAAKAVDRTYQGPSSLYKNREDGNYYLLIQKADTDPELFNRVCNIMTEYAGQIEYTDGMMEFFGEHMETILKWTALQNLQEL